MIRLLLKRVVRLLGRSDHKIIAVYATSGDAYRRAVEYVRAEAPQYPVWLLAIEPVAGDVAGRCERVLQLPRGPGLPFRAGRLLWPHWVVLNVVAFTRERGFGWLKAAPLFVLPWKLLIMNEHGDFFDGLPFGLARHGGHRLRDLLATAAESAKDLLLGVVWKIVWTMLDPLLRFTAEPWRFLPASPATPVEAASPGTTEKRLVALNEGAARPVDVRDLEILLERPDTFAAGFQIGRAGFQKDILPRAPFRQLQPGEAAAVLAPVLDFVLLDAAKLERLGGWPRTRSRRCGWLVLCWRAAAAGWKSYSVGTGQRRVPMIADRAHAEAEFCWRLLREPPPAPRTVSDALDRRRGSVCFQVRRPDPLPSGARRILIVSPYLPFPLSHGGAVRMFHLARRLSKKWTLLLITFREREDHIDYERLSSVFARVVVVDHDERRRQDPAVPEAVAQFRSRAMAAAIRQAGEEHQPDLLQVEYTQMAGYRDALPATPAVLVEHDVTFSLHEQITAAARPGPEQRRARAEFDRWYRYESHWLGRYEAVAVMSEEEKARAVAAGAPPHRTHVVPNGVDTERFHPVERQPDGPPELLYIGSFRHLPNMVGFQYLIREILPRLRPRFPDLRWRIIAGPDHQRHWRQFAGGPLPDLGPNVAVEGFVEDVFPGYARAAVVLVPLQVSAGTNIKVLEALACGKPMVSTPVGCAGLGLRDGEEILLARDAGSFAEAVQRVLADPALRRRLGESGRRTAVDRFSWDHCAARAEEMYGALLHR